MALLRAEGDFCQLLLFLCPVENRLDGIAVDGENLGVGELLEDFFALFFLAAQEGGKLALGQHRHTVELFERQADGFFNLAVAAVHSHPVVIACLDCPFGRGMVAGAFESQLETCMVFDAVVPLENNLAVAFVLVRYSDAGVLAYVVDANGFFGVLVDFEEVLFRVGHVFDTGGSLVKCKTDAVEQDGLAHAGVA